MPKTDHDTKQKILQAAEKVFHRNGFKGTRTIQIAEEAGISRTMLHYYFRTKESLFKEILENTLSTVLSHMKQLTGRPQNLETLISGLIDVVSDLFEAKPGLPTFLVSIFSDSDELAHFLAHTTQDDIPAQLEAIISTEKQRGLVTESLSGEDLIIHIYSLCAMPYLAMNYIKARENRDDEAMKAFISQRREGLKAFILNGIRP